jgi:hypothetical protein
MEAQLLSAGSLYSIMYETLMAMRTSHAWQRAYPTLSILQLITSHYSQECNSHHHSPHQCPPLLVLSEGTATHALCIANAATCLLTTAFLFCFLIAK